MSTRAIFNFKSSIPGTRRVHFYTHHDGDLPGASEYLMNMLKSKYIVPDEDSGFNDVIETVKGGLDVAFLRGNWDAEFIGEGERGDISAEYDVTQHPTGISVIAYDYDGGHTAMSIDKLINRHHYNPVVRVEGKRVLYLPIDRALMARARYRARLKSGADSSDASFMLKALNDGIKAVTES